MEERGPTDAGGTGSVPARAGDPARRAATAAAHLRPRSAASARDGRVRRARRGPAVRPGRPAGWGVAGARIRRCTSSPAPGAPGPRGAPAPPDRGSPGRAGSVDRGRRTGAARAEPGPGRAATRDTCGQDGRTAGPGRPLAPAEPLPRPCPSPAAVPPAPEASAAPPATRTAIASLLRRPRQAVEDDDLLPIAEPYAFRVRLIRDAAAALCLVALLVVAATTLAPSPPTGAVLSATGVPGPGSVGADAGAGLVGVPGDAAPPAAVPSGASAPTPSPTPTPSPAR